ncbi:MAG: PorT family protein [Flavobacteriales bacterium]|nr:PorT family protein [Flavobacteriales bacterium]
MRTHAPLRPLILLFLVLALPALGQRTGRSGIGLKAGGQMASWRSAVNTYNAVPGAVAGAYFPIFMGPRLELQPELLGSLQGAGHTYDEGQRSMLRCVYLQVPVTAKFFLSNTFNLQAGLQVGQLMLAQQDGTDVTDELRPFDIGTNMGLGLDLVHGFDLTLRYYSGMTPTLVNDDILFPHNRSMQLTAGYRITQFKGFGPRRRR